MSKKGEEKGEGNAYKKNVIKPKEQEKEPPKAKINISAEMKKGTKEAVPEDLQKDWKTKEAKAAAVEKALKASGFMEMTKLEKAEMKLENAQKNLEKAQKNVGNPTGFLGGMRLNAVVNAAGKVEKAEAKVSGINKAEAKKINDAKLKEIRKKHGMETPEDKAAENKAPAKMSFKGEMLKKLNEIKSHFQHESKEHEKQMKNNPKPQQQQTNKKDQGHGGR